MHMHKERKRNKKTFFFFSTPIQIGNLNNVILLGRILIYVKVYDSSQGKLYINMYNIYIYIRVYITYTYIYVYI